MIDEKQKRPTVVAHDTPLMGSATNFPEQHYTTPEQKMQEELQKKFTPKRENSEYLSKVYKNLYYDKKADRVFFCGTDLGFVVSGEDTKLYSANFCKDRLCPMCNWRRSLKVFGQVSQIMDNMPEDYEYLFLTLTVRNCTSDELPDTIQALFDGWRYLYNKNPEFKKVIKGTFRAIEVKKEDTLLKKNGKKNRDFFHPALMESFIASRADYWHPHIHVILAVPKSYFQRAYYITQARWTEMWRKACKIEYDPIVHIEKVYLKDKDGNKIYEGIDKGKAVAEAGKYAVKDSDYLVLDDLDESSKRVQTLLDSLTGRRLCGFTGVFNEVRKKLALDDAENGDLIHTDQDTGEIRDDIATVLYRYKWRAGAYAMIDREEI